MSGAKLGLRMCWATYNFLESERVLKNLIVGLLVATVLLISLGVNDELRGQVVGGWCIAQVVCPPSLRLFLLSVC